MSIFDPVIAILVGFISATLGYCLRLLIDALKGKREQQKKLVKNLQSLYVKLMDAKEMFDLQKDKRDKLKKMLAENHQEEVKRGIAKDYVGYNDLFKKLYPIFTEREKELHLLIRGVSESMRKINEEIRDWLGKDYLLRIQESKMDGMKELEEMLGTLRKHLNGWFAIYKGMFLNDNRYSLIYTADEWEHATGFPIGIERKLENIIILFNKIRKRPYRKPKSLQEAYRKLSDQKAIISEYKAKLSEQKTIEN